MIGRSTIERSYVGRLLVDLCSIDRFVGQPVGWLIGRSIRESAVRLVGLFVGRLFRRW